MIVTRLILKNWRNFRAVDVPLGQRVFLVGPNASGKSNLLDVFRFLRDVAKPGGGLQWAVNQRRGFSNIRCLAARREPDVEIEVRLSGNGAQPVWRYAIGIKQGVRGYRQPYLVYERVWEAGQLLLDRPDEDDGVDPERLTQTHLEQISANQRFRDVARFLASVRYLHLVPQLLRHPEAFPGPAVPEDPFGRNFLEVVAKTPEKVRRSRLCRIEAALKSVVPLLASLRDTKDEAGIPHLEALYQHWRPKAGWQREDQFSDGTLRLIGLFWSLLEGDSPLLLEEPELSLHPGLVSKLPSLIARLQRERGRQVLISTHSPDLLSERSIGGEETLLLIPDQEGTKVQSAASIREVRDLLRAGLSVADAVVPRTAPPNVNQLSLW